MDQLPIGQMLRQEFPGSIDDIVTNLSFFSITYDINTFANELNNYLAKMNNLDFECKINSNRDPTNQTPELAFSENSKKITLL